MPQPLAPLSPFSPSGTGDVVSSHLPRGPKYKNSDPREIYSNAIKEKNAMIKNGSNLA